MTGLNRASLYSCSMNFESCGEMKASELSYVWVFVISWYTVASTVSLVSLCTSGASNRLLNSGVAWFKKSGWISAVLLINRSRK